MRKIAVDDEVYAWLEARAQGFEQPNDVLRRELLDPEAAEQTDERSAKGRLWPLLEAGLIQAGDGLHHDQPRKGQTHQGIVEADGWITTKNGRYQHPSRALADLVGTSISGPAHWIHDPTGERLDQLNRELRRAPGRLAGAAADHPEDRRRRLDHPARHPDLTPR